MIIPTSLPMAVPLETTGQEYQYIIYDPTCKTVYYKGDFINPVNPTYIVLTFGESQAFMVNVTEVSGACKLNTSITPYKLSCIAADPSNLVYQYTLMIYNVTNIIGGSKLYKEYVFYSPTLYFNTTLPPNATYSYALYASINLNARLINGGLLTPLPKASLSAPLFGFFAFLLMLTLIMIGIENGKPLILLLLIASGLFAVSLLNLVQVPEQAAIIFIVLGAIFTFWGIKVR
jgi:hypothetical protein